MKKITFKTLLVVVGLLVSASTWALTADLSMSYELSGYKAKAFYDLTSNDAGIMPESGDLRFRSGYGLYNFGAGNRGADVTIPVAETDVLVCQFADTQNRSVTINSISGCTLSTTLSDGSHIFFEVNTTQSTINFNVGRAGCVVSVLVMEKDNEAATADYTLNYLYGGTPVKTMGATVAVGTKIYTEESFFASDIKYFRKAGEPESFTVAASGNDFTVDVRLAETYNYTLESSLGATLASGSGFEGESPRVAYPRYQLVGTKLYEASTDNKEYRKTINLTADNASATVTYTEKEGVEAAFYTEAETIEGVTIKTNGNIPVRASNALAATAEGDVTITTLPAGKYKFHVGIFTSKSSDYSDKTMNFGIGDETFAAGYAGVNLNEIASDEYELKGTTDITYLGTTSWGGGEFDYIWIEKTGDATLPANASVTVGSDGWATYVAEYDLDFSGVAGLEAYTATTDGSTVELTKVDDVAIGTCLVLKGAGTHTVPLIATSTTAKGGLTSGAVADVTADTEHVYYGLAMIGGKAKFAKITSGAIADGKAYFKLNATSPAREILDIDGETTGIENVKAAAENSVIYNLQGVRVAQPTKGLYIMDGKKMVIK